MLGLLLSMPGVADAAVPRGQERGSRKPDSYDIAAQITLRMSFVTNPVALLALVLGHRDSRFDERLRRDPGQLAWLHVEIEAVDDRIRPCEMQLHDGTHTVFSLPPDLATYLAHRASRWPFLVTRTREARAAYLTDLQLRRIKDQLRRRESSLASSLASSLLPTIEDRSCAALPATRAASLKVTLDELELLLSAAARVDASRKRTRRGVAREMEAVLDSGPPYSEKATELVHAIRAMFSSSADTSSRDAPK